MTASKVRTKGIIARDANIAVIFRRGTPRETQMLLWDLNTDEVTPGQWVRARVNVDDCDVTPDGRLLVAGVYDERPHRETGEGIYPFNARGWTTISRPPYFTALALWFDGSGSGGFWSSARDLHLSRWMTETAPDKGSLIPQIRRHPIPPPGQSELGPIEARPQRDGWKTLQVARHIRLEEGWRDDREIVNALESAGVNLAPLEPWRLRCEAAWHELHREAGIDPARLEALRREGFPHFVRISTTRLERAFPGGRLVRSGTDDGRGVLTLQEESGEIRHKIVSSGTFWSWMDLDGRGRVIYGDRGCLWAWADFPAGEPKLVADLNANRFEPVEAPKWAREWPT